jgi:hypothetical protein
METTTGLVLLEGGFIITQGRTLLRADCDDCQGGNRGAHHRDHPQYIKLFKIYNNE